MPSGVAHPGDRKPLFVILLFLVCLFPLTAAGQNQTPERLLLPPFLGRPTPASVALNVVAGERDIVCYARFRKVDEANPRSWQRTGDAAISAFSPATLTLSPLAPDVAFEYQVHARLKEESSFHEVAEQRFRTQRVRPSPFSFAMISDSHITPFNRDRVDILAQTSSSILERTPDLFLLLGDNIQTFSSHGGPMTEERFGPILYAWLRRGLGSLPSAVPAFLVNGNWEGENGWHPERERGWARQARIAFMPNPGPDTYPEGGSKDEDYYAFTWGDVLFVALNVTGYTLSDHAMQSPVGKPDDWTLGDKQKEWLFEKLSKSKAKWKLIFIHHTVGGTAFSTFDYWLKDRTKTGNRRMVGTAFIIDRDGTVY